MKIAHHARSIGLFICAMLVALPACAEKLVYTYTSQPLTYQSALLYGRPFDLDDAGSPVLTVSYVADGNSYSTPTVDISGYPGDYSVKPTWYLAQWTPITSFALQIASIPHTLDEQLADQQFFFYHDDNDIDMLQSLSNVWDYHGGENILLGPIEITWASDNTGTWTVTPFVPVPEPEAWAMLLIGLGLFGWMAWRRKRAAGMLGTGYRRDCAWA